MHPIATIGHTIEANIIDQIPLCFRHPISEPAPKPTPAPTGGGGVGKGSRARLSTLPPWCQLGSLWSRPSTPSLLSRFSLHSSSSYPSLLPPITTPHPSSPPHHQWSPPSHSWSWWSPWQRPCPSPPTPHRPRFQHATQTVITSEHQTTPPPQALVSSLLSSLGLSSTDMGGLQAARRCHITCAADQLSVAQFFHIH